MPELLHSSIPGLPAPKVGKVREVYDLEPSTGLPELLIVATDRISAFDATMANGIPEKGALLTGMSAWWMHFLLNETQHHVIATDDDAIAARLPQPQPELSGRTTIARKAKPLPIECVARGAMMGSLYKEYRAVFGERGTGNGELHGIAFPAGLLEGELLPEPIFTPATKAESGHDENISFAQAVDLVGVEVAETVRDRTLNLYRRAAAHAAANGLLLADTKFEFGLVDEGVILIDEALTPDSSRYWDAALYKPGGSPPSFDKQFVRDFLETSGWDKNPPGPMLPPDVVAGTRARYAEAYRRIVGSEFEV